MTEPPQRRKWTFRAGLVTLAAAVAPWRTVAIVPALADGTTAVAFAVRRTGKIVDFCGVSAQCAPGPGPGLGLLAPAARARCSGEWRSRAAAARNGAMRVAVRDG